MLIHVPRPRTGRHALRAAVVAGLLALGLAAPASAQTNDIYGTSVDVPDDVNCPIGPRPVPICFETVINNVGASAPVMPSAKDPVDFIANESVHAWAAVRAISASGQLDLSLVPAWVQTTTAWQRLGPVEDTVALADTVFLSTNATLKSGYRSATGCDNGAICVYEHAAGNDHDDADDDDNPRKLTFYDTNQRIEFSNYGFNDQASSVRNRKDRTDARMWKDNPAGSSRSLCSDSSSFTGHFGGFNDEASLMIIRSAGNDGDC